MISLAVPALVAPLLLLWSARRNGERWAAAVGLVAAALVLTGAGALVAALYVYVIDVAAALCGTPPAAAPIAGGVAYLLVVAFAVRRPRRRLWIWPFAVVAATAVSTFVAYWFSAAHHYCET